jgi:hypothetical protein
VKDAVIITYLPIEKGKPSDKDLFLPVLDYHISTLKGFPIVSSRSVIMPAKLASPKAEAKG